MGHPWRVLWSERGERSVFQVDEGAGLEEAFEVAGLHLAAGHDLLDGRELENYAEDGGHGAVVPLRLIVEDEVLELAALDGHEHGAVGDGDGGEHALLAGAERDSAVGAGADTETATQAEGFVEAGFFALGLVRVGGGDKGHGLDGTDLGPFAQAVA